MTAMATMDILTFAQTTMSLETNTYTIFSTTMIIIMMTTKVSGLIICTTMTIMNSCTEVSLYPF